MTDEEYEYRLKLVSYALKNALALLDGVGDNDWYVDIETIHDSIVRRIEG